MTNIWCVTFSVLIWLLKPTAAFPRSGLDSGGRVGSGTQRYVPCRHNLEYLHGNICCLNCPAGKYVKSHCTTPGGEGKCENCDDGMYTEYDNGLDQCFTCTKCRMDQEVVRPCTHTQDTKCQCKPGRFCALDQACEVCKKCSRCEKDQEIVRNCTSISNTECKKIRSAPGSDSDKAAVIVPLVLFVLIVTAILVYLLALWIRRRHCRAVDSQGNASEGLKAGQDYSDGCPPEERQSGETRRLSHLHLIQCRQPVRCRSSAGLEDERKELCESLTSSASNSQNSLTGPPPPLVLTTLPQSSPAAPQRPNQRGDEHFPKLVPVNGEESLRKCFEFFEEIDVDYHKRFFRHLGINDNVIKSKERLHHEDRIHELLHIWMEKEGKDASLNDLLKALLELNQRLTAENIRDNAISSRHYILEEE
ncbi:hypothetical protein LDENG_00068440 [Lucifuga dentata]|nr:hypothetical protein LDENG_00068440 [Lucifuga dentata]